MPAGDGLPGGDGTEHASSLDPVKRRSDYVIAPKKFRLVAVFLVDDPFHRDGRVDNKALPTYRRT
ncbi:hypothetical protein [Mesobaculum littorinae]|nr:hypothetical protein [Mesobaculum littorinae]